MRFRKAALKGRHKAHLEQERQQIEKEIEQSVNELKLQLELNRLKAVEKQVGSERYYPFRKQNSS